MRNPRSCQSIFKPFFNGPVLVLQERLQHDLKMRNVNTWLVWNRGKNVFVIYCYSSKILPSQQLRTWYNVHKSQEKQCNKKIDDLSIRSFWFTYCGSIYTVLEKICNEWIAYPSFYLNPLEAFIKKWCYQIYQSFW